jgi:hypothetical protein
MNTMINKNSLITVSPYYLNGLWVFDDPNIGLVKEPFVAGADDLIEFVLDKNNLLEEAKKNGFNFIVSNHEFPGANVGLLLFTKFGYGGTFYEVHENSKYNTFKNKEGNNDVWLCPALNLYYSDSPNKLYFDFKLKMQ